MREHAKKFEFEKAAELRDRIKYLRAAGIGGGLGRLTTEDTEEEQKNQPRKCTKGTNGKSGTHGCC